MARIKKKVLGVSSHGTGGIYIVSVEAEESGDVIASVSVRINPEMNDEQVEIAVDDEISKAIIADDPRKALETRIKDLIEK
tara:strand:+ start:2100 stop:2342 length:243 start_codon:yes stop_codon:yes gene_type:complete